MFQLPHDTVDTPGDAINHDLPVTAGKAPGPVMAAGLRVLLVHPIQVLPKRLGSPLPGIDRGQLLARPELLDMTCT